MAIQVGLFGLKNGLRKAIFLLFQEEIKNLNSKSFTSPQVKQTYARGQRIRDVDAVQGRLLDALEEVVDAVRVDGRLEVVEQLVLVVAQRPQELPLLVLGLDVRLSLRPETSTRIKLQAWLKNRTLIEIIL